MPNSLMTRPEGHKAPVKRVRLVGAFVRLLIRTSTEVSSAEQLQAESERTDIISGKKLGFLWSPPPPPLPPGGSCCGFWVCLSVALAGRTSRRSLVCLSLYLQQRSLCPVPLFLLRQKPEAISGLPPSSHLTLSLWRLRSGGGMDPCERNGNGTKRV